MLILNPLGGQQVSKKNQQNWVKVFLNHPVETRNGQACMIGLRDARTDHLTGNAERGIQQTNQLEKVKEMFTAIKNNFTRGYDILNNPAHIFAYLGFRVGF